MCLQGDNRAEAEIASQDDESFVSLTGQRLSLPHGGSTLIDFQARLLFSSFNQKSARIPLPGWQKAVGKDAWRKHGCFGVLSASYYTRPWMNTEFGYLIGFYGATHHGAFNIQTNDTTSRPLVERRTLSDTIFYSLCDIQIPSD